MVIIKTKYLGYVEFINKISLIAKWENQNKKRYYQLLIGIDLLGEIIVQRNWGSMVSKNTNKKVSVFKENETNEIRQLIDNTVSIRNKRGYTLLKKTDIGGDCNKFS